MSNLTTPSRECVVCGNTFYKKTNESVKAWNKSSRLYCSRQCVWDGRKDKPYKPNLKNQIDWPTEESVLENGSILHWDEAWRDEQSFYFLPVTCGICHEKREIYASKTRGKSGETFTGLCQKCSRKFNNEKHFPKGSKHPAWQGGRFTNEGYVYLSISGMMPEDQRIATPMGRKIHGKPAVVAEHRFVMAKHLDRPLESSEIVHHKNGDKLDNRLENLEITTHAKHRKLDVKYYNLWQDALQEIDLLANRIRELEMKLLRYKQTK